MTTELEILEFSYWEHFKFSRDLALIYSPDHPKMLELTDILNKMIIRIQKLKSEFSTED